MYGRRQAGAELTCFLSLSGLSESRFSVIRQKNPFWNAKSNRPKLKSVAGKETFTNAKTMGEASKPCHPVGENAKAATSRAESRLVLVYCVPSTSKPEPAIMPSSTRRK